MIKAPGGTTNSVTLSSFLVNSFEPGDKRRLNWTHDTTISGNTYTYAYKYKINSPTSSKAEYPTILRLAEQFLIRAEARAQQNNFPGAVADLNVIRNRSGLVAYSGNNDLSSVMAAVLHERQVELFTEFGHRWLDLKRTQTINTVMGTPGNVAQAKGGSWSDYKQLFPLPNADLLIDLHLTQNPGY
jgi:hypothetical protein